ncbi:MAG: hypothetical protein V1780_01085 [Chloroflexota bacterium]
MTARNYEEIDDLVTKLRLQILQVRDSHPEVAGEMKNLLTQLEDWVESLVVDSLKLKSLEGKPKPAARSAGKRAAPRPDREQG